jgi:hypothetical protein
MAHKNVCGDNRWMICGARLQRRKADASQSRRTRKYPRRYDVPGRRTDLASDLHGRGAEQRSRSCGGKGGARAALGQLLASGSSSAGQRGRAEPFTWDSYLLSCGNQEPSLRRFERDRATSGLSESSALSLEPGLRQYLSGFRGLGGRQGRATRVVSLRILCGSYRSSAF